MANADNNTDITSINSEFAQKWKDEIDKNYQNLLTVSWEFLKEKAVASQAEWYIGVEKYAEERFRYLETIHQGGTMSPVSASAFRRDLYRERALELFEMYIEIYELNEFIQSVENNTGNATT